MSKKIAVVVVAVLGLAGLVAWNRSGDSATPPSAAAGAGGGRGAGARTPMTVEFAAATRQPLAEQILVVGNLIGAATVEVVPRVNGRLQTVNVRLGDAVRRGQLIARVEDREIQEQVRQAEASYQVAQASIRQRDADLKLAKTNLDRSRSLYERQLLPQQTYDDTEARYQAALAQVDLARAQFEQAKARLDELKITLSNTVINSPVDGFVGKRFLDPGAFASTNAPVASVVDIRTVRMVANLVERDLKRVPAGTPALVEVDAFPGEKFKGKVSRVAPVFDPGTRTAEMEIEVPNADFRLKPGMYARVELTVGSRPDALTVPTAAVINLDGKSGVFVAGSGEGRQQATGAGARGTAGARSQGTAGTAGTPASLTVRFQPVEIGLRGNERIEIRAGLEEGAKVITTGAGALKDGDRVLPATTERARGDQGVPPGGRAAAGQGESR